MSAYVLLSAMIFNLLSMIFLVDMWTVDNKSREKTSFVFWLVFFLLASCGYYIYFGDF